MSQPAFWLRITPAYVIENFEELLRYVAAYEFSPEENPEGDFCRTVAALSEVAAGLADIADSCPAEEMPEWDIPRPKALRMVAAAVLAEFKRGVTNYDLILALMKMTLLMYQVPSDYRSAYLRTISACARQARLIDTSLHFSDLDPAHFDDSPGQFCARLARMKWDYSKTRRAFFEGAGTVIFDADGIEITPKNHDNVLLSERKRRKTLEVSNDIRITDTDSRRPNKQNISELFDWWPGLIRDMQSVKPSREIKLKTYAVDDTLDVRITRRTGIRIECESIDPDFEKLEGKILIDPVNLGVARDNLLSFLQPGDILPARYVDGPEFTFNIAQDEEPDFKQWVASTIPQSYHPSIFVSDYAYGTRWLSAYGLTINVITRFNDYIDLPAHRHEGACVKIRVTETKLDKSGNVVCNGVFLPESEQNLPDIEPDAFRHEAADSLAKSLIAAFKLNSDENPEAPLADICAPGRAVSTLAILTLQNAIRIPELPSADRLTRLIAATAMFEATADRINSLITRREISYLAALSAFAMGENPASLAFSVPEEIVDFPRSMTQLHVLHVLRRYKESSLTIRASVNIVGQQMNLLEQLVDASNTLIDKIDVAELSRIKKVIASKLGVGDLFRDTNTHRTFYGFENDTTEFKISCARPPANMQGNSPEEDARIQAFVILKTVCAFLNSPSGGDLLIGVNDEGYAVGIRNDMDILYDNRMISEPNADRVRVYIKNIIDHAFVSNDDNVSGNAITAGNIMVNIEQSKENQFIIRIKINPYPYDVVKIRKEYMIPGYKNVYYRSSATSMPLDSDGVRNVRIQKISRLDVNESKLATILEAIDKKKQLKINDYRSRSGLTTRRVEPHMLVLDNTALQAYDHSSKQMRLFKLSRIGAIKPLSANWECEKKHRTLPVDIFGTMQSEEFRGTPCRVKMSDYALMLLTEEYPAAKSQDNVTVAANSDADASRFPWTVDLTVYNPAGLTRFLNGLPEETLQA